MYTINRRLPARAIAIPDGYTYSQPVMIRRGMGDAWSSQQTMAWMLIGGAVMAAGLFSIWKVA